jgi:hypothetical protein
MIKWSKSKNDVLTVAKIAARAHKMNPQYEHFKAVMDIEACHCNGCPLDLERLLAAQDYDFAHDVFGIARHIDRSTGELTGCFEPRFARRETATA